MAVDLQISVARAVRHMEQPGVRRQSDQDVGLARATLTRAAPIRLRKCHIRIMRHGAPPAAGP